MISQQVYNPAKAHAYYLKTRQLKGRQSAVGIASASGKQTLSDAAKKAATHKLSQQHTATARKAAKAKIARITLKLHSLENALKAAESALKTQQAKATQNSDGKTTQKEKIAAKQFRDTHKSEIAATAKKTAAAAPKATSASSTTDVTKMSTKDLTARITKIKGLISNAHSQIKAANAILKS